MVEAVLLSNTEVDEVMAFYLKYAREEILYPKDPKWMKDHLGTDFFLAGIRISGELSAVGWMAKLKDFVYFVVENDNLLIKNDGSYAYSGGWCVQPDDRGLGLFKLFAATINLFWFTEISKNETSALWGRMVGQKDADGNPLFWNKVGEKVTGLSYKDLLQLPFGTMEATIYASWPKEPMPFKDIYRDIIEQTLGKTFEPLIGPLNAFIKWGLVEVTDRYAPTSLNCFHRTTKDSIPDPQKFFDEALAKTLSKLDSFAFDREFSRELNSRSNY